MSPPFINTHFQKKSWKGPNGASFLSPKSDGEIYMVSGYQSREFGLGFGKKLTPTILATINNKRKNNRYVSSESAILINGSDIKKDIIDDPSLRYFHAGINNEGYWNSNHSKIQLEDVTDCLEVLYPNFDVAHMYDQSAGHTKIRSDGLLVNLMNVAPGGAVPLIRSILVTEMGPYETNFNNGDEQDMVFKEEEDGPFWLKPHEKISTKTIHILVLYLKRTYQNVNC